LNHLLPRRASIRERYEEEGLAGLIGKRLGLTLGSNTRHMTSMVRRTQFRLGSSIGWRGRTGATVSTVIALALAIAVIVLALGLALVLIPIVMIGVLIASWRLRALRAALARADRGAGRTWDLDEQPTIEADYTVTQGSDMKTP
jgi:hypothetical protein